MPEAAASVQATPGFEDGDRSVPLVLDVDGTLFRSDLMWEGIAWILACEPRRWWGLVAAVFQGRAAVKAYAAATAPVDVNSLPTTPEVVALMDAARSAGRPIVLATACHESYTDALADRFAPDAVLVARSPGTAAGAAKRDELSRRYACYDYVGDSTRDLAVWSRARHAYVVNPSMPLRLRLRAFPPCVRVLTPGVSPASAVIRALRPHQWTKNLLLLLPAAAAHVRLDAPLLLRLAAALIAFCATASAIYLHNDLADLSADRRHPRKRARPLAAGDLSAAGALVLMVLLLGLASATAAALPRDFALALGAYGGLAWIYSVRLKRLLLVDVIVLALLYTIRVIAGAAVVEVALSRWFLAFSLFLFFALAVAKRVTELQKLDVLNNEVGGRAYRRVDAATLVPLGAAATAASCLVYTLYITSSEVGVLYANPDALWAGLPLLLYVQARVWIFAGRGELHDDPVAFATRDRVSLLAVACFVLIVAAAS